MVSFQKCLPHANEVVKHELRRFPSRTLTHLKRLGLHEDLTQELFLAYYSAPDSPASIKRAVHAAGERFRYHEIVRPTRRNVPEAFAPRAYRLLVHGDLAPEEGDGALPQVA